MDNRGIETPSWTTSKKQELKSNTTDLKSFYYLENGKVTNSILETIESRKDLLSDVYNLGIEYINNNAEIKLTVNDNFEVYSNEVEYYFKPKVEEVYNKFFDAEIKRKVNKLGYKHKMGLLLYGKAGTGKTSILKEYFIKSVKEQEAIVFVIESLESISFLFSFISKVRKIQDNPIVVFMDELDEGFKGNPRFEGELKIIMDGIESIDNCFFMAATNYIEQIPKTLTERPSRFKYCIEVEGIQDEATIENFIKTNLEIAETEFDYKKDIEKLKGSTVDELKEYVLDKIMDIQNEKPKKKSVGFKN